MTLARLLHALRLRECPLCACLTRAGGFAQHWRWHTAEGRRS